MNAKIQTVIITDLELRGDGKEDPYRRILQCYSLEGELLFEKDHWLEQLEAEKLFAGINKDLGRMK